MSQQKRQSNLYAAENWKQVYESFFKINLTAYDFDTIRESMINYLRLTYPDAFNDWIESSEFIFILDTISMLGQNLAFRMDLNSRENFLDTSERRASVLKLAKMISYAPKRAYPGRGLAKLTEIKTNQDIRNSFNESLKNKTIRWNDPADNNWYENFILVMNSSFISSNQFGNPVKKNAINGVTNQLYRMNTIPMSAPSIPFTANINGTSTTFEVVNPDINSLGADERHPEPQDQKYIIYRNDGNGFASPNTGFFVYFKQGTLSYTDYQYDVRIENRIQNVNTNNINETDVWVQEINEDGIVRTKWTKVPSMESIAYNSVDRQKKTIFSVTTRDNDQISIKYPDQRSGVVPRGTFRTWYRVSNGETYTIKTSDIQNKSIKYVYRTKSQTAYENSTLDIKFSLQYETGLAQSAETIEQIKDRAPQMYYTQNRFVNGEDYNIAPLMLGNTVLKAKALNRIYSGQSRFIDINDPTGKYQNTDVFADDGALYKENITTRNSILLPTVKSNESIIVDSIQPLIGQTSVIQTYQEWKANIVYPTNNQIWTPDYNSQYSTNTYGRILISGVATEVYEVGTLINFKSTSGATTWASIVGKAEGGYYVLSQPIDTGLTISSYIKPYRVQFNATEIQNISVMMAKKTDFIIIYDTITLTWIPILSNTANPTIMYNGVEYPILVRVQYTAESWEFDGYGVNYVFVGGDKVKFYFVSTKKISDISTGTVQADKIDVLACNSSPETNLGMGSDVDFQILDTIQQENGYLDGSRVIITSKDIDSNGIPLEPNQFASLVPSYTGEDARKYGGVLVFRENTDFTIDILELPSSSFTILDSSWTYTIAQAQSEGNLYKRQEFLRNVQIRSSSMSDLYGKGSGFTIGFVYDGKSYFVEQIVGNNNDRLNVMMANMSHPDDTIPMTPELAFYRAIVNSGDTNLQENKKLAFYGYKDVSSQYSFVNNARTNIMYHWKHYAPDDNRIDPSKTNLIDMYVLTNSYKTNIDLWIKNGALGIFPKPPTSVELQDMFKDVEQKIVISDSIIWHSANYVPLFGNSADPSYQADIKVVKIPNSTLSDDEIRQRVIEITNNFFKVENWNFGDTFFYTELCAYIHMQLSTEISTVVLVPNNPNSKFGELFEIPCEPDQLFVSTATVDNVSIISSLAKSNINIGN